MEATWGPTGTSQRGYQSSPCENCCAVVPNHCTGNCPHPEFPNFGVRFTLVWGEEFIAQIRISQRSYLNGITNEEELCLACNWFMMREIDGVVVYHNLKDYLRESRIVLMEHGDLWEIKFYEDAEPPPKGLCTGKGHAHESWQEYKECYMRIQDKFDLCRGASCNKGS